MIWLLLSILLAENICLAFWLYTRPDRAARNAERESLDFLKSTATKILNRAWGVQGAPAMDDEFEEPEAPAKHEPDEDEIRLMDSEQARRELEEVENELDGFKRQRSDGPIGRRRRLVAKAELLRRQAERGIPPQMSTGDAPYISTLEPDDEAHLSSLKGN